MTYWKIVKTIENKRIHFLCLAASPNQYLWVPTHFAWSHHNYIKSITSMYITLMRLRAVKVNNNAVVSISLINIQNIFFYAKVGSPALYLDHWLRTTKVGRNFTVPHSIKISICKNSLEWQKSITGWKFEVGLNLIKLTV